MTAQELKARIAILKAAEDAAKRLGLDAGARQLEQDRSLLEDELYGPYEGYEPLTGWRMTNHDGSGGDE